MVTMSRKPSTTTTANPPENPPASRKPEAVELKIVELEERITPNAIWGE